ncbi:hypothetical protein F4777DRAFT_342757 [Nemania sp. FL0916]|nr:hypothetical protein F4777DRAFT_342757 [Nemania sp. FL0916]
MCTIGSKENGGGRKSKHAQDAVDQWLRAQPSRSFPEFTLETQARVTQPCFLARITANARPACANEARPDGHSDVDIFTYIEHVRSCQRPKCELCASLELCYYIRLHYRITKNTTATKYRNRHNDLINCREPKTGKSDVTLYATVPISLHIYIYLRCGAISYIFMFIFY